MTQRASQTTSHVLAIISHALLRPSVSSLVRQRKLSMKAVRRAVHRRRNPCAVQPRGGGGHTAGGSAGGPRAAATDVEGSGWTAAGGAAPARGAPAATSIAAPIPEPQPPRGRRGGRPPAARAGRRRRRRQKDGVYCWRREARCRREKHPPRCNGAGAVVAHWRRPPRRWHCRRRKATPPRRRRVADLRAKEASKIQNAAMARVQCSHAIALTHLRRRGLVSGGRGGVAVAVGAGVRPRHCAAGGWFWSLVRWLLLLFDWRLWSSRGTPRCSKKDLWASNSFDIDPSTIFVGCPGRFLDLGKTEKSYTCPTPRIIQNLGPIGFLN